MKNPEKRWSWQAAFKNATGGAANGAAGGVMVGMLDPTGASIPIAAAVGAAVGFVGSVAGDTVGFLWDDEPMSAFASIPLYNFVVGLLFSTLLVFASLPLRDTGVAPLTLVAVIAFVTSMFSAASARLIDDIRVRMMHRMR